MNSAMTATSGIRPTLAVILAGCVALLAVLFVVGWFRLPVFQDRWYDIVGHVAAAALTLVSLVLLAQTMLGVVQVSGAAQTTIAVLGLVIAGYWVLADGYSSYTYVTGCFTHLELLLGIRTDYSLVRALECALGPVLLFGAPLLFFRRVGMRA